MKPHVRKRIAAVCQVIFLVVMFRWEGWYGNLEPIPWTPAVGMAIGITLVTLRLSVIIDRRL